jgi:hypothetical protein
MPTWFTWPLQRSGRRTITGTAMKRSLLLSTVLFAASCAQAAEAPLYQLSVNGARVENGKILNMTFRELSRNPGHSIVETIFVSGGSVSSSMFILRGACGVARVRGERFFTSNPVPQEPGKFRLQFQARASDQELRPSAIGDKVFSLAECEMMGF